MYYIFSRQQKLAPAPVHRLTQEERYVEHNTKDVAQIYKDITALTKTKVCGVICVFCVHFTGLKSLDILNGSYQLFMRVFRGLFLCILTTIFIILFVCFIADHRHLRDRANRLARQ